jgi:20S proteasome alpha/beta subunit
MTVNVALQIIELAVSLFRAVSTGAAQSDAQILTDIIRVAAQAYQNHVGQPIDPSLIKPEAAI